MSPSFKIPYRLETVEDITRALDSDLLKMGTDYRLLLSWAKNTTLHRPPAFVLAKNKVTKDFIVIREEKIQDVKITFSEVAKLPLVVEYPEVKDRLPWIEDIIRHENLFQFFHSFPLEIRKRCLLEHLPDSPTAMYSAMLAIRKLLRRELIVYVKAKKTSTLSLVQLKQSLVALTIFTPNNEDVLYALKEVKKDADSPLRQNAMAEILFARLPRTIHELLTKDAESYARKLSSKLAKLKFSSRQIINLMGYFRQCKRFDDLSKALNRIDGVAMKISISRESKDRLHDYIESLKKNIERAPFLYRTFFLGPELETCQKLYHSIKVMQSEETVTERIVKHYTRLSSLDFYPTKDYLDFLKGQISNDCTGTHLGEQHLLTPQFFNIRIFKGGNWIGNIYMLDFCQEHRSLIIDRIQIPRDLNVFYYQFFDSLKDVLINMFEGVDYEYILMPLSISNHGTIQDIFNEYRRKLSKKARIFDSPYADHFESLRGRKSYYVFHKRE